MKHFWQRICFGRVAAAYIARTIYIIYNPLQWWV